MGQLQADRRWEAPSLFPFVVEEVVSHLLSILPSAPHPQETGIGWSIFPLSAIQTIWLIN